MHHFLKHGKNYYFEILPFNFQEELGSDPCDNLDYRVRYLGPGCLQVFKALPQGWGFWGLNPGEPAVVSPLRFPKFGVWRHDYDSRRPTREVMKYSPIKYSLFQVMGDFKIYEVLSF